MENNAYTTKENIYATQIHPFNTFIKNLRHVHKKYIQLDKVPFGTYFLFNNLVINLWYVSNVSIIFDAPCLFLHYLPNVSLHLVALLCIFRN
jgi:hypothetical protein